jgi:hypothetical protein
LALIGGKVERVHRALSGEPRKIQGLRLKPEFLPPGKGFYLCACRAFGVQTAGFPSGFRRQFIFVTQITQKIREPNYFRFLSLRQGGSDLRTVMQNRTGRSRARPSHVRLQGGYVACGSP